MKVYLKSYTVHIDVYIYADRATEQKLFLKKVFKMITAF